MTIEKAIDLLDNLVGMITDNQDSDYDDALKMAINALKAQADSDTVTQPEIIHCNDCKHKGTKNCVANAWTTIFGVMVNDDFYCGLAERRTDD